jgi:hypothetical protein
MEIAAFKVKCCNLPVLTFGHSNLNIWSYKTPFDPNSIVLDSWLKYLSTYQSSAEKIFVWGRYDFSKMTYEFCQETGFVKKTSPNYIPKHPNQHPSFYFSNLARLSQSLKISCKTISPFLGK